MTTAAQSEYRKCYLPGEHWRTFRGAWWAAHPSARCLTCGRGHPLDLHHLTYARRGHEQFSDVIPLCRADHELAHGRGSGAARRWRVRGWVKWVAVLGGLWALRLLARV
jgi:hypothetical protein